MRLTKNFSSIKLNFSSLNFKRVNYVIFCSDLFLFFFKIKFRSIRRIQNQQAMRARLPSPPCPPAELPIPQTSTLRSRRRLANILVIAGFVFMACWLPHVICLIFREFSINSGCSNTVTEFVLLLGMKKLTSTSIV